MYLQDTKTQLLFLLTDLLPMKVKWIFMSNRIHFMVQCCHNCVCFGT